MLGVAREVEVLIDHTVVGVWESKGIIIICAHEVRKIHHGPRCYMEIISARRREGKQIIFILLSVIENQSTPSDSRIQSSCGVTFNKNPSAISLCLFCKLRNETI